MKVQRKRILDLVKKGDAFPFHCIILEDKRGQVTVHQTSDFPPGTPLYEFLRARTQPLGIKEREELKDRFRVPASGWENVDVGVSRQILRVLKGTKVAREMSEDKDFMAQSDDWLILGRKNGKRSQEVEAEEEGGIDEGGASQEGNVRDKGRFVALIVSEAPDKLFDSRSWKDEEPPQDEGVVFITKGQLLEKMKHIDRMKKPEIIAGTGVIMEYLNKGTVTRPISVPCRTAAQQYGKVKQKSDLELISQCLTCCAAF